jgi:hypothetical protein
VPACNEASVQPSQHPCGLCRSGELLLVTSQMQKASRVHAMYTNEGILGNFVLLVPMQAIKSIRIRYSEQSFRE